LGEWQAEIDELQSKADQASSGIELEITRRIDELRAKCAVAESKLAELRSNGNDERENASAGIDGAFQDLRDRVKAGVSNPK
jgi:hypothetical protein